MPLSPALDPPLYIHRHTNTPTVYMYLACACTPEAQLAKFFKLIKS